MRKNTLTASDDQHAAGHEKGGGVADGAIDSNFRDGAHCAVDILPLPEAAATAA